jgi:hypothetical protein
MIPRKKTGWGNRIRTKEEEAKTKRNENERRWKRIIKE